MTLLFPFTLVLLVLSLGAGSVGDLPATAAKPRLEFRQLYPLTVRGLGFEGRERVRVTVLGRRATTKVVADRRGRFVARLAVRVPRCGSVVVRAVGSSGSRAVRELPRPDCVEP